MYLDIVYKGWFNRKAYYRYYFAAADHYELIEKQFFDSLPQERRTKTLNWIQQSAYQKYIRAQIEYDNENGY